MTIQSIINRIFRQDFSDKVVLGRTLFGMSMLFLGLLNLFNVSSYASYAPDYLPVPHVLVVLVGLALVVLGFMIFANCRTERASLGIIILFGAFILIMNLPTGNMFDLAQNITFISAALLIGHNAQREKHKEPDGPKRA
jgi:uncharacterized membrane protein